MEFLKNVNSNTILAYNPPSDIEPNRKIIAENFDWITSCPKSLAALCIIKLSENWEGSPKLQEFTSRDQQLFLKVLDTKTPLHVLAGNIDNNMFWARCYRSRWSDSPIISKDRLWICVFMEKYYAEVLETINPRQYDPEKFKNLVKLCGPYIHQLKIGSLIPADLIEQRTTSPEMTNLVTSQQRSERSAIRERQEVVTRDHISMHAALGSLNNLTEFHITYQQKDVGVQFRKDQFQFTINDAKNLARGLEKCSQIKILRITRTEMDCVKLRYILRGLLNHEKLETLDFSHCKISDEGMSNLAKFIAKHEKLKNLILADNVFGPLGAEQLSYSLNHSGCSVRCLDLRLNNRLGSEGIAYIAVTIARGCNLTSLNISGCGIKPEPLAKPLTSVWSVTSAENPPTCGELLARAIGLAKTPLRSLDISVNNIGSPSDQALSNAICLSYIVDVNLKRSGMGSVATSVAESAAAAQRLRREAEKGIRFRRSAGRVVQARRVVKGMNIDADPILLAQQLSARPSIVSVTSEEGIINVQTQPLPSDFSFVPMLKLQNAHTSPLPSSRESSITGPPTSRRSSHNIILEPVRVNVCIPFQLMESDDDDEDVIRLAIRCLFTRDLKTQDYNGQEKQTQEIRRTALVRRSSDGSLLQPRNNNAQRHIKIFVSKDKYK